MSVNTAEGSMGIFTSFKVYPNSYSNPDSLKLIDFPSIDYNDIKEVTLEKIRLSEKLKTSFSQVAVFPVTSSTTFGKRTNTEFIQGNSYAFKLSVMTKSGQKLDLLNKSTSTEIAHPEMNCAKLNNVYRKACHNCFQESIVKPKDGGFYQALFYTRVVELDVHSNQKQPNTWNWNVRHTKGLLAQGGTKNNCSNGSNNQDQSFGWCIDNIKDWHNNNLNHDVIILFIDLKSKWNKHHNNQTPANLDLLLEGTFGATNIYKPKDLLGNFSDMRRAAQQNNWPSMGDLTGKFMFVLTGDDSKLNGYMSKRTTSNAVAFCAASVKSVNDVKNLSGFSSSLRKNIVFYNMQQFNKSPFGGDADFNTGYHTSALGYINRTYGIDFWGDPGDYDNSEYTYALNFNMNNVAVANIESTFNSTYLDHGIQWNPTVVNAYLDNTHIYSSFANVTQAATQTIRAKNLIVEPGANYRMIARESVTLLPGTKLKAGSNVGIRIDNCSYADYSLRPSATAEQLTQEQIDALMQELNKELYSQPSDGKEMVHLSVYPNPTTGVFNVAIGTFKNSALIEVYNIMGKQVFSKTISNTSLVIDISNQPKGIYVVKATINNTVINKKIVYQ